MLNIELLKAELKNLERIEGVLGSAIVNRNGLFITASLPREIDPRKFSAMAAFLFGALETASKELTKNVYDLIVEFNEKKVVILEVNHNSIIICLLELNINLGLILIEIEEIIQNIKDLL